MKLIINFFKSIIINDIKIYRNITRKLYYKLENYEYYKNIPIRNLMMKNLIIDEDSKKEDIKKSTYKWVAVLKPNKKKENKLFF